MTDMLTSKDILIISIEIIIGLIISFFTAYVYEKKTYLRKERNLFKKYGFLQSGENEFDWQHWNIENGKIAEAPITSYMSLKYKGSKSFSFRWSINDIEKGSGFIFWDDVFHGKMSFYEEQNKWFDYRNVYYKKIKHKEKEYDAIFVNADDQNTRYAMLREYKA